MPTRIQRGLTYTSGFRVADGTACYVRCQAKLADQGAPSRDSAENIANRALQQEVDACISRVGAVAVHGDVRNLASVADVLESQAKEVAEKTRRINTVQAEKATLADQLAECIAKITMLDIDLAQARSMHETLGTAAADRDAVQQQDHKDLQQQYDEVVARGEASEQVIHALQQEVQGLKVSLFMVDGG